MKYILFIIPLLLLVSMAGAQNNPIFYGGAGDGWHVNSYAQQGNSTIYHGGEDDGWFVGSYLQSLANSSMYRGGNDDGWQFASYLQAANQTMYRGDTADGWNMNSYLQLNANAKMYQGDTSDGWHMANYLQAGNDYVYFGGEGDGWASVILPLGPLPIELLAFTAFEKNGMHVLNWTTANEMNAAYFEVDYSANTKTLEPIGKVKATGNTWQEVNYDFINHQPMVGQNFYRLKMVDEDNKFKYSNVILLLLSADKSSITIYPNPTAAELNIALQSNNKNAITLKLYDLHGKIMLQKQFDGEQNNFSINIESLASGMYQLVIQKGSEQNTIKIQKQ